jgi:hypothetical protein
MKNPGRSPLSTEPFACGPAAAYSTREEPSPAQGRLEAYRSDPSLSPSGHALAEATERFLNARRAASGESRPALSDIEQAMCFVLSFGSSSRPERP